MRRRIPHNPLLRLAAFLVYTGSAGGILWCVLLFIATMLAACAAYGPTLAAKYRLTPELMDVCGNMAIIFGYVLCYCLTTAILRMTLLRSAPTVMLSVIAALLGAAMCVVPSLIAFFLERNVQSSMSWYLLGSPMVLTTGDQIAKEAAGPVVIWWLMICVPLSAPWAIGQWRRFVPYVAIAAEEASQSPAAAAPCTTPSNG